MPPVRATLLFFLILLAPLTSAYALTMQIREAYEQLGLSTATEPGQLTVEMINKAYSKLIREQLNHVMAGSSVAVAASQKFAEARAVLLDYLRNDCQQLLEDYNPQLLDTLNDDEVKLLTGKLMAMARRFSWSPENEQALLSVANEQALRILVASRRPLSSDAYKAILARLPKLYDENVLQDVARALERNTYWRDAVLNALQTLRDNPKSEMLLRLWASQELIDTNFDVGNSKLMIEAALPSAVGSELFQVTSWSFSSSNCPPDLRLAIQRARIPQRHQVVVQ